MHLWPRDCQQRPSASLPLPSPSKGAAGGAEGSAAKPQAQRPGQRSGPPRGSDRQLWAPPVHWEAEESPARSGRQ